MTKGDQRTPSLDERLAMGRIAEILAEEGRAPIREIDWICDKYGFESGLKFADGDRTVRRDETFLLLIRTLTWTGFAAFLAELLELQLVRHMRERYADGDLQRRKIFEYPSVHILKKAIGVLGYEVTVGRNRIGETSLAVLPSVGEQKQAETSKLRSILAANHPNALESLQGAYEAYMSRRTDGNRQAIESARNALERVVRDLTGKDLGPGLPEICGDDARTTELFKELRDYLGVQGPHANESRSDADGLLGIHMTEDALVWILQRREEW